MQLVDKMLRRFNTSIVGMSFARDAMFDCPECQDTGFVKIAHPTVVQAYCNGVLPNYERSCMALCDCDVAQRKMEGIQSNENVGKHFRDMPIFGDAPWHVNMNKPGWRDRARAYRG